MFVRRTLNAACVAAVAAVAGLLAAPLAAQAADTPEQAAIRQVMASTWDKPEARLQVDPIVVLGNRAVAGWTQQQRGGRALLARDAQGRWRVTACAGDGLKEAKALELSGMPPAAARQLAARLAEEEARQPAARLALFSTFEGMVRMDGDGQHPPHAAGSKH